MNLCLITEDTALLGLDRHVCELQLVPAPLAPLLVSRSPRDKRDKRRHGERREARGKGVIEGNVCELQSVPAPLALLPVSLRSAPPPASLRQQSVTRDATKVFMRVATEGH